jgi:peptidoglycan/xylan/chitin deacetylase (PgdA/CDA1 family)
MSHPTTGPPTGPIPYDENVTPRGHETKMARPGALVISLDFELHWGMRDHVGRTSPAFADLAGSRQVVADLADLFADRGIRATWATVGFLFASTGAELSGYLPERRPSYRRQEFDPYSERVGEDEAADPEHLAGSLVDLLASTPGQEVASHTFSHYYCLEDGQHEEELRADLASAQAIAGLRGLELTSLVLPRNQWNPHYAAAVLESGFTCIRGPQPSRGHQAQRHDDQGLATRAARLVDTYAGLSPPPTTPWESVRGEDGLSDIPASAFLRPYSPRRRQLEALKLHRMVSGMRDAARRQRIFHVWWHPHNFARHPRQCFELLGQLLDEFDQLADQEGMRSMTMRDVATSVDTAGRAAR